MSYVLEVLPALLNGAVVTLQVFFIVIVLSIPLGIVLAFLMQIKFKPLNWLLTLYVWIMRGTPLLLQLIFVYYVLPSVGIVFDRLPAAILAFTLNYKSSSLHHLLRLQELQIYGSQIHILYCLHASVP